MPRTRSVLLLSRFGLLFTLVGFLVGAITVIDLLDGKEVLTELLVLAGILLLGIALLVYTARTRKAAMAKDWAALAPQIRRDLPYGAQEVDGSIDLPTKLSWVVILALLALVSLALGVYGLLTEEAGGAIAVMVMMSVFGVIFAGFAWLIGRARWSVDTRGVSRTLWSHARTEWNTVTGIHTDPRQRFVLLVGADGKPRMRFQLALMEISALDLVEVLKNVPKDSRSDQ